MFYIFAPASWTNGVWYGVEYGVSPSKVDTEPKPKDCDFIHSPLGDKGCSYKAHVKAYNAADENISHSKLGKFKLEGLRK
jgi:hypothetical protein